MHTASFAAFRSLSQSLKHTSVNIKQNNIGFIKIAVQIVINRTGLNLAKFLSNSRERSYADGRKMLAALCDEFLIDPYTIGYMINRERTSVIAMIKAHEHMYSYDKEWQSLYDEICVMIESDDCQARIAQWNQYYKHADFPTRPNFIDLTTIYTER